jgi:hypothetical protein
VPTSTVAHIAAPAIAEPIVEKPAKAKRSGARKSPRNLAAASGRGRAPNWRAPTRWARAQPRRSGARIMILLALVAIAALLVDQGLIDIDRWREILSV